ncbi:hypothetical protein [Devosia sp.]|uniref:hypothetical protein n=1 Tax=Devosia sp. TaxID=1871048 RepID=UPI003267DA9D
MALKFIVPVLALLTMAAPAQAAGFDSAYTDINLDECSVATADDFGSSWACPGYKGYPVYVAEGDLRMFVSYGFGAQTEMAAQQTPPPFNTLGPKIEWRLSNASGGFKPIATIVRYLTEWDGSGPTIKGQVLVVTQLVSGNTCHIAYIDALANADANEQARAIADKSGTFDCQNDAIQFSKKFTAWDN